MVPVLMRLLLIVLPLLLACEARVGDTRIGVGAGSYAEAQGAQSGGGLYKVTVLDGGLCSGKGTRADPLDCPLVTDGVTITGNGSTIPLSTSVALESANFGAFGDGSDGVATISVDTTLGRDTMYDNLTIDEGVTLNTNGYRVFVKNTLTLNGKLARNGNNGANGNNGSNAAASCTAAAGGAGLGSTVTIGSLSGATSQANPGSSPPAPSASTATPCATNSTSLGGATSTTTGNNGAAGPAGSCRGGGGGSGGGFPGTASVNAGNSGSTTTRTADHGNIRGIHPSTSSRTETGQVWSLGTGGGAGSCGRDTINTTEQEPGGGGGGGAGGWVILMARVINQGPSGGVEAKGGNGGDGGDCGTHTGNASGGGAGGGGGGGIITSWYNTGNPTFDVSGGLGGAGGTGCVGGPNGGNGGNGAPGLTIINKLGR